MRMHGRSAAALRRGARQGRAGAVSGCPAPPLGCMQIVSAAAWVAPYAVVVAYECAWFNRSISECMLCMHVCTLCCAAPCRAAFWGHLGAGSAEGAERPWDAGVAAWAAHVCPSSPPQHNARLQPSWLSSAGAPTTRVSSGPAPWPSTAAATAGPTRPPTPTSRCLRVCVWWGRLAMARAASRCCSHGPPASPARPAAHSPRALSPSPTTHTRRRHCLASPLAADHGHCAAAEAGQPLAAAAHRGRLRGSDHC